jgi:hypothetical protein
MVTYQPLKDEIRNLDTWGSWVYVPLPPGDTVVSCGPLVNRDLPSEEQSDGYPPRRFLVNSYSPTASLLGVNRIGLQANEKKIRMRLSGETIVGRYIDRDDRETSDPKSPERYAFFVNRLEHPPKSLLYSTGLGWPKARISIITTYSEQGQDGILEEPWYHPPAHDSARYHMHSHTPLENIRQVRVFYRGNGSCKGMLVDYDDGGQRAVGQCRLHVDPSDTFKRPSRIAFLNFADIPNSSTKEVYVLLDELPPADDPQLKDWQYYEMTGTLDFWFGAHHESMEVRGGTEIPQMDL